MQYIKSNYNFITTFLKYNNLKLKYKVINYY